MGKIERTDLPDGSYKYTRDGKFHREDGPAVRSAAGDTWWFREGLLHREDGPAVEHVNGGRWWFQNGKLHREDGPAYEGADGAKGWFLEGMEIDPKFFPGKGKGPSGQKPPQP